jgi:hypothetical protein
MGRADVELASVERALDVLEAEGARSFDAASCDCVRTLLERAEELGGDTAALLAQRAHVHVERLADRFRRAGERTKRVLARVESERGKQPSAHDALTLGDVVRARRVLRRALHRPLDRARISRMPAKQRALLEYDDSVAELVASFALARALDVVPEHAGPYNPLRIASDLLSRMRTVSPIYLTAQLNRLEELASLLELPELPPEVVKTLPGRKRRAPKKGS